MNILQKSGIFLIRLYRKTLSLDHGPLSKVFNVSVCIYEPTCSEYTEQAIAKYGFFKGCFLGFKRILRCNPWAKGGSDPLK
jgi:hypothetical protein